MVSVIKIKNGCNCYIVENGKAGILIDTGLNNRADMIIKACKEKKVKVIIITHGHMDHIQCAAKVADELQIPIFMHEKDLELVDNNLIQPMYGRKIKGKILAFFSALSIRNNVINHFEVTNPIIGEKTIQEGGMKIKIIELPGHTKGSIGIRIENHFFVGDALMNMGSPDLSLLYENMHDLLESANKITNLGDVKIHFGHGNAVDNRQWVKETL